MASNEPDIALESFKELFRGIEVELRKVIVGHETVVRQVLLSLLAGGHVLLEGPPGTGKTLLARTLAEAIQLRASRVQFTPDLMPADITGTEVLAGNWTHGSKQFEPGPIFAEIVLIDEINRGTPKTQAALLEAMAERVVTVNGTDYRLPTPFFVIATQNPIEMEGTYPLPEAELDRFMFKIVLDHASPNEIIEILKRTTSRTRPLTSTRCDASTLLRMSAIAREVPVASRVLEFVAHIIEATRPDCAAAPDAVKRYVRYGASARGAQAIVLTAKVLALSDGRFNVSKQDVLEVAIPALRHRLLLSYEGQGVGIMPESLIGEVLSVAD